MAAEYPFSVFRFEVDVTVGKAQQLGLTNPLCRGAFSECDGLEMTMEPRTVREGGNNTEQPRLVGPVTYGNLTLKRGMTSNVDLWKWFALSTGPQGRSARAQITVAMMDGAGHKQLTFVLNDCLPIKMKAPAFNAKDGLLAIEEMQVAYSSFSVSEPTG